MKVEISAETEAQLLALVQARGAESIEQVIADIVAVECQWDMTQQPMLESLLNEGRADIAAGRSEVLTRDLAATIAAEGRDRMAQRERIDQA
ncbi:MAG: hypothetical protein ABI577_17265 [bacterium]